LPVCKNSFFSNLLLFSDAVLIAFFFFSSTSYRKRPISSNIFSFALECWHLALTVLSFIMRLAKFLAMTGMYVGRIDRPILQNDLMLDLDSMPRAFRQDMLLAEAHHHPYLERLGLMYMMKLRYGDQFSTTAGATWRLLFVAALMPWLRKHRIQDEKFDLNSDTFADRLKQTRESLAPKENAIYDDGFEAIQKTATDGEEIGNSPTKSIKSIKSGEDAGYHQVSESAINDDGFEAIQKTATDGEEIGNSPTKSIKSNKSGEDAGYHQVSK